MAPAATATGSGRLPSPLDEAVLTQRGLPAVWEPDNDVQPPHVPVEQRNDCVGQLPRGSTADVLVGSHHQRKQVRQTRVAAASSLNVLVPIETKHTREPHYSGPLVIG